MILIYFVKKTSLKSVLVRSYDCAHTVNYVYNYLPGEYAVLLIIL